MSVKVEGLKELRHAMKKLPGNVQNRVIASANRAGAAIVVREARRNVPIREGRKLKAVIPGGHKGYRYPGYLKKNIGARRNRNVPRWTISHIIRTLRFAYYGAFLEFGTSNMAAKPWLRPAFEAKKQAVVDAIKKRAWIGIERETKKLNK